MNRGINIYTEEIYIGNEEDLSNSIINKRFTDNYFWSICKYVNQKFRDIGTFLDRNDVNDMELLEDSRKQGLEDENE